MFQGAHPLRSPLVMLTYQAARAVLSILHIAAHDVFVTPWRVQTPELKANCPEDMPVILESSLTNARYTAHVMDAWAS